MKRETLLTLGPLVVFIGLPMYLAYTVPADVPLRSWPDLVLVAAAAAALVPGAIFIVISLVRSHFPAGAIRRVQDVERSQVYTAIGYGCLVTALTLDMATTYPGVAGLYGAIVLAWALWNVPSTARRVAYRLRTVVRCTPEEAFALVSDPRKWHTYLPDYDVFGPVDLPLHAGSTVQAVFRQGRRAISEEEQVIAYDPGLRFGTASVHRRPTDGVYDMAPVEDGTEIVWTYWTVLTYSQAVLGGPFARRALVSRVMRRRQESMDAIKTQLESPAPVPV